jgi:uncharacterized membrane protein
VATMTVLEFDTPSGADRMIHALADLQQQRLITVLDAAMVSWPEGAKKPKTEQLHNLTSSGALGGAFWGLLFGLIFFVPLFGMAVGAAFGALSGALSDVGIDDDFIKRVRDDVKPGSSALFLLSAGAVPDRLAEEVRNRGLTFKLVSSNLSQEQEAKLREIFGAE